MTRYLSINNAVDCVDIEMWPALSKGSRDSVFVYAPEGKRFNSPGELDALINQLIQMRNRVWPWPPFEQEV